MNVQELIGLKDSLFGREVEIFGVFVLVDGVGYFVGSSADRDDKSVAVKVVVDNLKKVLLDSVPPSGGSKYYYLDDARVVGRLGQSADGYACLISDVTALEISKSGHRFVAIP